MKKTIFSALLVFALVFSFGNPAQAQSNADQTVLQNLYQQLETIRVRLGGVVAQSIGTRATITNTPSTFAYFCSGQVVNGVCQGDIYTNDSCNNLPHKCKDFTPMSVAPVTTPVSTTQETKVEAPVLPTTILRLNTTGPEVVQLQKFLVEQKLLDARYATGVYDANTVAAVRTAQSRVGANSDGTWGPNTATRVQNSWGNTWGEGGVTASTDSSRGGGATAVGGGITIQPVPPQTLCLPNSAPWVKVLGPNGGETFTAGQQITVTWTSCNVPPNQALNIQWEQQVMQPMTASTVAQSINDGFETITLPFVNENGILQAGMYYRILVSYPSGLIYDRSDNLFTINSQQSESALMVTPLFSGCTRATTAHPRTGLCNVVMEIKNTSNANVFISKDIQDWYPNNNMLMRMENSDGSNITPSHGFGSLLVLSEGISLQGSNNVSLSPNQTKLVSASFLFDLFLNDPVYPIQTSSVRMNFRGVPYRSGSASSSLIVHNIPSYYSSPISL